MNHTPLDELLCIGAIDIVGYCFQIIGSLGPLGFSGLSKKKAKHLANSDAMSQSLVILSFNQLPEQWVQSTSQHCLASFY